MFASAAMFGGEWPSMNFNTGHSFMGSAVGGVLSASFYGRYCGLGLVMMLDVIAPLVPLGHAVGKLGCLLSGDGCYGPRVGPEFILAMSFPNGGVPTTSPVHPTPIYESILSGALFLYLHLFLVLPAPGASRTMGAGMRAAVTLSLYGIERMIIEPFRRHPASTMLWGLTEYQGFAVIFLLLGALISLCGRLSKPWPQVKEKVEEEVDPEPKAQKAKSKAKTETKQRRRKAD